ncbi:carbamoyltransferase N-terminal domain-containing protein [Micromonospora chersina]|uniref:carbamoyltransferase N-terminal domain-containing protein n=1 Tax=Micromonospora chersina TaxID=47854 RepID=UPI00371C5D12
MLIAGLGHVHGGGLAVLRDNTLEFAIPFDGHGDTAQAAAVLGEHGYDRLDAWAVSRADDHPPTAAQVAAAYCTSPFALRGEPALVVAWNRGGAPLLHHAAAGGRVEARGALLPQASGRLADGLSDAEVGVPAAGAAAEELTKALHNLFRTHLDAAADPAVFLDDLRAEAARLGEDPGVVGAAAVGLLAHLVADQFGDEPVNLCFTGDLAADPRWATALRRHPRVAAIWIPPFPGESGVAVGAAALHLFRSGGLRPLRWTRRCGPLPFRHSHVPDGWSMMPCRPEELARVMHRTGQISAIVTGRADLGPETLGSRAVIAPATGAGRLDRWGPVTMLCPLSQLDRIAEPGEPDPYAQFRHHLRAEWAERLAWRSAPDGTTLLRTVSDEDDPVLATILAEYAVWTGTPVLAGASAGYADAVAAMCSGDVDLVWSDQVLYRRISGNGEEVR